MKSELSTAIRLVLLTVLCASALGCMTSAGNPGKPSLQAEYHIAPPDVLRDHGAPGAADRSRADGPARRPDLVRSDRRRRGARPHDRRAARGHRRAAEGVHRPARRHGAAQELRQPHVLHLRRGRAAGCLPDHRRRHGGARARGGRRRRRAWPTLDGARLVRPSSEGELTYPIYFAAITEHGYGQTNYLLQPGDVVYVPPNGFAKVGYALGILFFPLQQILGLGGTVINAAVPAAEPAPERRARTASRAARAAACRVARGQRRGSRPCSAGRGSPCARPRSG